MQIDRNDSFAVGSWRDDAEEVKADRVVGVRVMILVLSQRSRLCVCDLNASDDWIF